MRIDLKFLYKYIVSIIIAFSLIKRVAKKKTYLQVLSPIIGLYHCLKGGGIDKVLLPFLLMVVINFVPVLMEFKTFGLLKWIQLFGFIFFVGFIVDCFKRKDYIRLVFIVEIVAIIIYAFEYFSFGPYIADRKLFGVFEFGRYAGLVGEPNFSALAFFIMFLMNFHMRRYKFCLLDILLILPTQSRTAYLVIILFVLSILFKRILTRKIVIILFSIVQIYPFIVLGSWNILNNETKLFIAEKTADRYIVHAAYTDMYKTSILGSGYGLFNERFSFDNIPKKFHEVIKLKKQNYSRKQQHNTPIQVLTEFGLIGFTLYICFQIIFMSAVLKHSIALGVGWFLIYIFTLSINSLSEIFVYIYMSYILTVKGCIKTYGLKNIISFLKTIVVSK